MGAAILLSTAHNGKSAGRIRPRKMEIWASANASMFCKYLLELFCICEELWS